MMTIAEYAESRHVSQPAIRRQIQRYHEELQGHIYVNNRRRVLDDEAIAFLDSHRQPRAIVVSETAEENKELHKLLFEKQEIIAQLKDEIIRLTRAEADFQKLLVDNQKKEAEIAEKSAALTEKSEALERKEAEINERDAVIQAKDEKLDLMEVSLHDVKDRLQQAEEEVNSFQKSLFGFYRKVKK